MPPLLFLFSPSFPPFNFVAWFARSCAPISPFVHPSPNSPPPPPSLSHFPEENSNRPARSALSLSSFFPLSLHRLFDAPTIAPYRVSFGDLLFIPWTGTGPADFRHVAVTRPVNLRVSRNYHVGEDKTLLPNFTTHQCPAVLLRKIRISLSEYLVSSSLGECVAKLSDGERSRSLDKPASSDQKFEQRTRRNRPTIDDRS